MICALAVRLLWLSYNANAMSEKEEGQLLGDKIGESNAANQKMST